MSPMCPRCERTTLEHERGDIMRCPWCRVRLRLAPEDVARFRPDWRER